MQLRHLLFATDLSDASLARLGDAAALARSLGARLSVLHMVQTVETVPATAPFGIGAVPADVGPALEAAREALEEHVRALEDGRPIDVAVVHGSDVALAVHDWAQEHDVDLVVATTHGRSGFRRLVLGSQVEAILRRAEVPVLCLPLAGADDDA